MTKSRRHPFRSLMTIASLMGAAALGPIAIADERVRVIELEFELDRSRLATPSGVDAVYRDLERKAGAACLRYASVLEVDRQTCTAVLVDKVVAEADSVSLTVRHEAGRRSAQARAYALGRR